MTEENKNGSDEILTPIDKIIETIKELQSDLEFLPPFRDDVVTVCVEEIKRLYELNDEAIQNTRNTTNSADSPEFQIIRIRQEMMERIKRTTYAYLNERIKRIKEFKWTHAGALSSVFQANMSDKEKLWLKEYTGSLFSFQQNIGKAVDEETDGVNLIDAMYPPKNNLVPVSVLHDYGEIETIDGVVVVMKAKTVHCIPRIDIEPLIRKEIIRLL
ncbi:unnamed protein product [Bursaphelenchus xylophilus]|nr:unnamed protein product [Bursaphelenchus xylophilus]CAG9085653.1 unnamed protein product [Bursaphelenchus xylophilus]